MSTFSVKKISLCDFNLFINGDVLSLTNPLENVYFNSLDVESCKFILPETDLEIQTLPVWHGANFVCIGYSIFDGKRRVVIITDVSQFVQSTIDIIDAFGPFDTFLIDGCGWERHLYSHICLFEALFAVYRWTPKSTYILGSGCMTITKFVSSGQLVEFVKQIDEYCANPNADLNFKKNLEYLEQSFVNSMINNTPPHRQINRIELITLGTDGLKI